MGEKSLSRLSVLWANCILKSNVKNLEGILMHGGMGKKKKASERAWWSYFSLHFVKNIRRFILKPEARREYYCHV